MRLIARLLARLRARRRTGVGYGAEVLFAGWVELPRAFLERDPRPVSPPRPSPPDA